MPPDRIIGRPTPQTPRANVVHPSSPPFMKPGDPPIKRAQAWNVAKGAHLLRVADAPRN